MIPILAAAFLAGGPAPGHEEPIVVPRTTATPLLPTDKEFCAQMGRLTDATMKELPKMVDAVTRTDGISVICALRSYAINKTMLVDESDLREGWREGMQQQWNTTMCGNWLFKGMIRRGWRMVDNVSFKGGHRYIFEAHCD